MFIFLSSGNPLECSDPSSITAHSPEHVTTADPRTTADRTLSHSRQKLRVRGCWWVFRRTVNGINRCTRGHTHTHTHACMRSVTPSNLLTSSHVIGFYYQSKAKQSTRTAASRVFFNDWALCLFLSRFWGESCFWLCEFLLLDGCSSETNLGPF